MFVQYYSAYPLKHLKIYFTLDGKKWCSTKTDAQGVHVKGNWGYCDDSKCRERSKDPENCRTTFEVEAPSRGLPCVFPFKHDKKTFYECTDHNDPQGT